MRSDVGLKQREMESSNHGMIMVMPSLQCMIKDAHMRKSSSHRRLPQKMPLLLATQVISPEPHGIHAFIPSTTGIDEDATK